MNELRIYLSSRSKLVEQRMWVWILFGGTAFMTRLVIIAFYPGWWMLSPVLLLISVACAFMAGRGAGWRDCWQEVIKFHIARLSKGQRS